jgi:pimeloyl-ACP methyl ester carboxylesterase
MGLIDPDCREVVAVELPFDSVASDVAVVRQAVQDLGGDTVVCGHSYGGRLTSIVASTADLAHLIYLAAPAPNAAQLQAYAKADRIRTGDVPSFDIAWQTFFSECTRAQAQAAWARLRPMPSPPGTTIGLENRPWERLPSTYIVCLRDHALKPDVQQQMARNMRYSASIDSDHSPFLTAPKDLAKLLNDVLRHGRPRPSR